MEKDLQEKQNKAESAGASAPAAARRPAACGGRLPAIILAACLIAGWEIAARAVGDPHLFPGPAAILRRVWELKGTLLTEHMPGTLATVAVGWGLAILLGAALAVLMNRSARAEAMLLPVMTVTQTVPMLCISPLFVLWLGYTLQARVLAVVLSTFYAIALNTYQGLRSADPQKMELMRSLGASRGQIFRELELPSALPLFFAGLRMTLPWAVIDAAVAEWLGATSGLGYFSKRMIAKLDGPGVFAPILILCLLVLAGMGILKLLDRKLVPYRGEL